MIDKVQKIREEVEKLQKRAGHNFDISLTENERQFWLGEFNVLNIIGMYIDTMQDEPVSNPTPNKKMSVERWKMACEAACCDRNYRSHYGLTETRDDYFVDGVQWADENPKEETASDDLEEAAKRYATEGDEISGLYIIDEEVEAFKAGANWQKEQMMAKVFPAEIDSSRSDGRCILSGNFARFETGEKVKVIVIKED